MPDVSFVPLIDAAVHGAAIAWLLQVMAGLSRLLPAARSSLRPPRRDRFRNLLRAIALAATLSSGLGAPGIARAAMGWTTLAETPDDGPVTVFYPTDATETPRAFGPFIVSVAAQAVPAVGNGRLVIVSHGSGGSPWEFSDLARALVATGFVVALPTHRRDNSRDSSEPGPASWTIRPREISHAIDAVIRDPRWAAGLDASRVGLYGMSAGGHAALSLAGGRWSPARMRDHCDAHLDADFAFCSGANLRLGGRFDGLKRSVVRWIDHWRFGDPRLREDHDPRIAAIVAAVPVAADFDPASLTQPRVPLAFVTADQDRWLLPAFHAERILAVCQPHCERLAALPNGGHGALLSPLPPGLRGIVGELLADPPGFDRAVLPAVDQAIVQFFQRQLGRDPV